MKASDTFQTVFGYVDKRKSPRATSRDSTAQADGRMDATLRLDAHSRLMARAGAHSAQPHQQSISQQYQRETLERLAQEAPGGTAMAALHFSQFAQELQTPRTRSRNGASHSRTSTPQYLGGTTSSAGRAKVSV